MNIYKSIPEFALLTQGLKNQDYYTSRDFQFTEDIDKNGDINLTVMYAEEVDMKRYKEFKNSEAKKWFENNGFSVDYNYVSYYKEYTIYEINDISEFNNMFVPDEYGYHPEEYDYNSSIVVTDNEEILDKCKFYNIKCVGKN